MLRFHPFLVAGMTSRFVREKPWPKSHGRFLKSHGPPLVFKQRLAGKSYINDSWLVVEPTPLKNMKVKGMIIPNIWENKHCSKPPTRTYTSHYRLFDYLRADTLYHSVCYHGLAHQQNGANVSLATSTNLAIGT